MTTCSMEMKFTLFTLGGEITILFSYDLGENSITSPVGNRCEKYLETKYE